MDSRSDGYGDLSCGRYDVQRSLGEGAYGKVLQALHVTEGKWVAIKTIDNRALSVFKKHRNGALVDAETAKKHLKQEVSILRRLKHCNIVAIEGAFYDSEGDGLCTSDWQNHCARLFDC